MRLFLLLLVVFLSVGCNRSPPGTIAVGQPWAAAERAARDASYTTNDASTLATDRPTAGFYLDLPGNRGLIVYRDDKNNSVSALDLVDNWPGPIASREYRKVKEFGFSSSEASKD